jgi:hypothetical protein
VIVLPVSVFTKICMFVRYEELALVLKSLSGAFRMFPLRSSSDFWTVHVRVLSRVLIARPPQWRWGPARPIGGLLGHRLLGLPNGRAAELQKPAGELRAR